jgi:hypothetical protein
MAPKILQAIENLTFCLRLQRRSVLMQNFDLPRRLVAEALGTGLLVATVVGSGIMAESLTKDLALALLGNTLPGSLRQPRLQIRPWPLRDP